MTSGEIVYGATVASQNNARGNVTKEATKADRGCFRLGLPVTILARICFRESLRLGAECLKLPCR